MLEKRLFEDRQRIAQSLEREFLERYFGTDPKVLSFGRTLIFAGQRDAALALNRLVSVVGSEIPAERVIAKIKQENKGSLPEETAFNLQVLQRSDADLMEIDRQNKEIEQSKIMLDAQLAQIEPMAPMIMPDGKGVAPPADQLRALESQLAMLEGRYSPDHPDVQRTRRDVEALRREVGDAVDPKDTEARITDLRARLATAREHYSDDHPEVQTLKRQIKSLEDSLAVQAAKRSVRRGLRGNTASPRARRMVNPNELRGNRMWPAMCRLSGPRTEPV